MAKQILEMLKKTINARVGGGFRNVEILRNIVKEEIQYYVLNFIYHHQTYSKWTMYGGSALRICHDLNRMSVDLDFEIDHDCTQLFLNNLKKEVERYFAEHHELDDDMFTVKVVNGRGLLLRFSIGEELGIDHHSKQVHVKIDLNHFIPREVVIERIPINKDQLSFVIKIYNMSTLMASKIAAILLRGARRVGKATYEEKGRDIYDLLWYMEKKTIPDLGYLRIRTRMSITGFRMLFNLLTLQMNKVNDENLKQDLCPLFLDQNYIGDWLEHWRESYYHLKAKSYNIYVITNLAKSRVLIHQDFDSENYSFIYIYDTEENRSVKIIYVISAYWLEDLEISTEIDDDLMIDYKHTTKRAAEHRIDQVRRYATLFYKKNATYFKEQNSEFLGDTIQTKIICTTTTSNWDPNKIIMLNRSTLLKCKLEDLV